MSALTEREQRVFNAAKNALPRWLFGDAATQQELVGAFAKEFSASWDQADEWLNQAFILRAFGFWLDQLAKDRGTSRRAGETDDELRTRLRNVEDQVTAPALITIADGVLANAGGPTGAKLVELRRDKAFFDVHEAHIQCIPVANLLDGELFTISDGINPTLTFEFDVLGNGTTVGQSVNVSGSTTADDVASVVAAAINLNGASLFVFAEASAVEPGAVHLTPTNPSVLRVTLTDTVADTGFFTVDTRARAYMSRGYRMAKNGENAIIMILPYGTSAITASAVAEEIRRKKAAGVVAYVETRGVP